jgi:hypothetical protein
VKKLKYQGAITKILSEKIASYQKKSFLRNSENIFSELPQHGTVNFDIISFSGIDSFEDQLLSIYSFMYYAGIPKSWTIYSDKSYTIDHKNLFEKYFSFVSVIDWDVFTCINKHACLDEYLKFCHLAKKVNVILGHEYSGQTMYVDSDVIFYKHISYYLNSAVISKGLWYISDTLENAENHLSVSRENIYPLNSGFLILNNEFNKQDVITYFENLKGNFHYFSEQSSFEFAFRKQAANILEPADFIVDVSDQFDFSAKYSPDKIAMRHYVSPVRHKMWQSGWKWHFVKSNPK